MEQTFFYITQSRPDLWNRQHLYSTNWIIGLFNGGEECCIQQHISLLQVRGSLRVKHDSPPLCIFMMTSCAWEPHVMWLHPPTPHNTHTRTTHQSHWFRVWLKANTQTSPPAAALGETVNYWMYVQTMSHQIHAHQTDSPTGCAFPCDVFENSRARARRLVARLLLHIVRREGEFLMSAAVISSVQVKTRLFVNPLFPPCLNFQWSIWAALTAWHLTALVSWPRRVHVSLVKNRAGDCSAKLDFHPSV